VYFFVVTPSVAAVVVAGTTQFFITPSVVGCEGNHPIFVTPSVVGCEGNHPIFVTPSVVGCEGNHPMFCHFPFFLSSGILHVERALTRLGSFPCGTVERSVIVLLCRSLVLWASRHNFIDSSHRHASGPPVTPAAHPRQRPNPLNP